jgi:hypothetical protein
MKNILFALAFCISSLAIAQAPPPPQIDIASDKKILIDQLIKTTGFETYVTDYCIDVIQQVAQSNNWDSQKKEDILNSNFKFFNRSLYYYFINTPNQDLKNLIEAYEKINLSNSSQKEKILIPFNTQMRKDLEHFIMEVLTGKYKLSK